MSDKKPLPNMNLADTDNITFNIEENWQKMLNLVEHMYGPDVCPAHLFDLRTFYVQGFIDMMKVTILCSDGRGNPTEVFLHFAEQVQNECLTYAEREIASIAAHKANCPHGEADDESSPPSTTLH